MPLITKPKPAPESIQDKRRRLSNDPFALTVVELEEVQRLDGEVREATNAANRQKTVAKNAWKVLAVRDNLSPDDEIRMGEIAYSFNYSYSEVVEPSALYEMFKKGEITEAQFLGSLKVGKEEAKKLIGEHILLTLAAPKRGKEMDIRKRELDPPDHVAQATLVSKNAPTIKEKLNRSTDSAPPVKLSSAPPKLKLTRKVRM